MEQFSTNDRLRLWVSVVQFLSWDYVDRFSLSRLLRSFLVNMDRLFPLSSSIFDTFDEKESSLNTRTKWIGRRWRIDPKLGKSCKRAGKNGKTFLHCAANLRLTKNRLVFFKCCQVWSKARIENVFAGGQKDNRLSLS